MATIDASIPLQAQAPQTPSLTQALSQAYQLKDTILKDKQQEQTMQTQSALRQIYADPTTDISTPEGQEKLVKKVSAVDPTQGMQLQKDFTQQALSKAEIGKNLAQMDSAKFETLQKHVAAANEAEATIQAAADGPNGKNQAFMNHVYKSVLDTYQQQGLITPEARKQMPENYDPNFVKAHAMQVKDFAEHVDREAAQREKSIKDAADIHQGQQRIGIEAENASTNRARLGYEENQPKTELGKIEADYKAGKIGKDEYTAAVSKAEKAPGTTGGAMAANYTSNMVSASSTARGSIERFQSFGGKTNPSFTLAAQGGHNGFKQDFIEKVVKGKLPSEQQKQFDSNVGGLAIAAGRVFNDGQRPSQTTIDEIEKKLSPQPDDTAETMNYRYGAMGQDVINELKGRRAISSPEQQKNIDDEIKQWEPIANLAQSGGNPSGSAEKAEQTRTGSAPDYSNLWN
jgi:hypothetical protein